MIEKRVKELEEQVEILKELNYAQNECLLELKANFEILQGNFKTLKSMYEN